MANMRVQSMLSNAFLKSTKMEISRRSPHWAPSINLRRHNICSSVPRSCRKPFWFFLRSGSAWGLTQSMTMRLYVFAASPKVGKVGKVTLLRNGYDAALGPFTWCSPGFKC